MKAKDLKFIIEELKKGQHLAWREWAIRASGELGEPYLKKLAASMTEAIKVAETYLKPKKP